MSNFGDQSLRLLQAQSTQLAKGDLVRVKQSNGDWAIFKIYSRHRQQWYNVSSFDDDSPSHSLKLVPGGRWYAITDPRDRRHELEGEEVSKPPQGMSTLPLPVEEEKLLELQESHPSYPLSKGANEDQTQLARPSILPQKPTKPSGSQLEIHQDVDNEDAFNLEQVHSMNLDDLGFNPRTADLIALQFAKLVGIEELATLIRLISDWQEQATMHPRPRYEDQLRFSTIGRDLLKEFQNASRLLTLQNPDSHEDLTEVKFVINKIVGELLEKPTQVASVRSPEISSGTEQPSELQAIIPTDFELRSMEISPDSILPSSLLSFGSSGGGNLQTMREEHPSDLMSTPVPLALATNQPMLALQLPEAMTEVQGPNPNDPPLVHDPIEAQGTVRLNEDQTIAQRLRDQDMLRQRLRWDDVVEQVKERRQFDLQMINRLRAEHEQDIDKLKKAIGGLKVQTRVEQQDVRSEIAPIGSRVADINKQIQSQQDNYQSLAMQVDTLRTTTMRLRGQIQDSNQADLNWKRNFEREFHSNLATLVDGISNLRRTIEGEPKGTGAKPKTANSQSLEAEIDTTMAGKLALCKTSPCTADYQRRDDSKLGMSTSDPAVECCLEELDEVNERINFLCRQGQKALDSEQDATIKEMHSTLNHRIDKIQNNSQQIRRNYKQTVRSRLSSTDAGLALQHESFRTNLELMRQLDILSSELSEQINVRGLSLPPSALAKSVVKEFTTFCGTTLPLVHEFLEESEKAMIQTGISLANRGAALINTLRGPAKTIVSNSDLPRHPSFDEIADVLKTHFGQVGFLTNLLQRLHKEHGPIPPPFSPEQSIFEVFNTTKEHMRLIKAARYLQDLFLSGKIPENVVNSPYLNLLEEQLPGEHQCRLSEIPRFNTEMSTTERFNVLLDTYGKLSNFASAKIAKFGIKEDIKAGKKKKLAIPALTTSQPLVRETDSSQKLLRFQENIPIVPLPLPNPKVTIGPRIVTCYNCNEVGHYATNCPKKLAPNNDLPIKYNHGKKPPSTLHNLPNYTIGKTTCYVCLKLGELRGVQVKPTDHVFKTSNMIINKGSCPMLTELPTVEERETVLTKARICLSCLKGQIDDDKHRDRPCLATSKFTPLKCAERDCFSRYDVCGKHIERNKVRLQVLKNSIPELALSVPSLITSPDISSLTGSLRSRQVLCSGPQSYSEKGLLELMKHSKPPIMENPGSSTHFMLQLIHPKEGGKPALCVFDTGSLTTLATQKTISSKLHSSPIDGDGSKVQGLGGTIIATPHLLSIPLDPTETQGHPSKVVSCLSVSKIISIQPLDTSKVEQYLRHNYDHILPEDFRLYNFGSLGPSLEVDILLGITDLAIFPRLLFSTNCGLHVYKSPLMPAPGTSPYIVAGTLPSSVEANFQNDWQAVTCASLYESNGLLESDPSEEERSSNESHKLSGKENPGGKGTPLNHLLTQNTENIVAKEHGKGRPKLTSERQLNDLLEADVQTFRCLSCQLCRNCSKAGPQVGNAMSLKQEIENEMVKNSVTLDIESCRLIAKLILPANYRELLGDNRDQCILRLRRQLRKLSKRDQTEQMQVKESIGKLIKRGFVSLKQDLSPEEADIVEKHQTDYYLPTAIVFKSGSLSTPSRVCLDASAKSPTGFSLNDLLPKGMCSIRVGALVHHWKSFPIAISGDLSSYFCRFNLTPEYWPVQKFLWIPDLNPDGDVEEFFVKTVIFGVRSSSLICQMGLQKVVDAFSHLQQLTIYVDDVTSGYFDADVAEQSALQIAETLDKYGLPLKGGGFAITGKQAPNEILDDEGRIGISCVKWHPIEDTFTCNLPPLYLGRAERGSLADVNICPFSTPEEIDRWLPSSFNLRDLLSKTASNFDGRLGLVASLTTRLRQLVRHVSTMSRDERGETNWSFVIPTRERRIFCDQMAELKQLSKFEYPRFPKGQADIQTSKNPYLLCFTDSGDYETIVMYLAYQLQDGSFLFNYLTAASYLKTESETVPRSELNASARGANLVREVLEDMRGKMEMTPFLFTDSLVSIHWMVNVDSLLHIFQRNRVAAVLSIFGSNIYHVKSEYNLADITSRHGTTANDVSPSSTFYRGPEWLKAGFSRATQSKIIMPASELAKDAELTPDLLDAFRSGVILSKYVDHNFLKLKKQVNGEEGLANKRDPHASMKLEVQENPEGAATASETQAATSTQQPSSLIAAADTNTNDDPDLTPKTKQRPAKENIEFSARGQALYFIDPHSKPFLRLCRIGALVLRFVQVLLKKTLKTSSPDRFRTISNKIFISPPRGWEPPWPFIHFHAKPIEQECSTAALANTQSTGTMLDNEKSVEKLLRKIQKLWHRYPGIDSALTVALDLIEGHKSKEVKCTSEKAYEKVETLASILTAWRQTHTRLPVRMIAQIIAELTLSSLPSLPRETLRVDDRPSARALMEKVEQIPSPPNQYSFANAFTDTQDEAPQMMTQTFLHLVRAEQNILQCKWGRHTLRRRAIWRQGFWMNNTRWRDSVGCASETFFKEPGSMDFSRFIKSLMVPVLDAKDPLYQSLSHFIHHSYMLPDRTGKNLQSKHRGVSQDLTMALKFAHAPYAIQVFKRIRDECMNCQLRTKRVMRTQEGDLHMSRLRHKKPFYEVHIDLAGPILVRAHQSAATRRTPNQIKTWTLVAVCSWTRAMQAELMTGTSASDIADGLFRVMSIVGSIAYVTTDQLAAQLKVLREAKFLEQVQHCLYERSGFHTTVVPVSRHNFNGTVEVRIRSLRQMLALKGNKTELNLLQFSGQIRLATSLINATPYAYSFKGGEQHPQLQLISPSSFLYPLAQLHKPVLGPVLLEQGVQHYFKAMKCYYESMVTTFIENVVPIISAKNHNYKEASDKNLEEGDLVLFKKRPGNNLLPGWSLGRISQVKLSRDGVVRSVQLTYPLHVGKGEGETDPLVEALPQSRARYDKNLFKVHTIRQTDELIKLFPLEEDSKENISSQTSH